MAAWRPGDALPDDTLWTTAMVAQYIRKSERTVQRSGCPQSGVIGRYEPAVVRAFFSRSVQRI